MEESGSFLGVVGQASAWQSQAFTLQKVAQPQPAGLIPPLLRVVHDLTLHPIDINCLGGRCGALPIRHADLRARATYGYGVARMHASQIYDEMCVPNLMTIFSAITDCLTVCAEVTSNITGTTSGNRITDVSRLCAELSYHV